MSKFFILLFLRLSLSIVANVGFPVPFIIAIVHKCKTDLLQILLAHVRTHILFSSRKCIYYFCAWYESFFDLYTTECLTPFTSTTTWRPTIVLFCFFNNAYRVVIVSILHITTTEFTTDKCLFARLISWSIVVLASFLGDREKNRETERTDVNQCTYYWPLSVGPSHYRIWVQRNGFNLLFLQSYFLYALFPNFKKRYDITLRTAHPHCSSHRYSIWVVRVMTCSLQFWASLWFCNIYLIQCDKWGKNKCYTEKNANSFNIFRACKEVR